MSNKLQLVKTLISDLKTDLTLYQELTTLLVAQCTNLSRRDNDQIYQCNQQILGYVKKLKVSADRRIQLFDALGLEHGKCGIEMLCRHLPSKAADGLVQLWTSLETAVTYCQRQNTYNGKLLADQHQLISTLMQPAASYYSPTEQARWR